MYQAKNPYSEPGEKLQLDYAPLQMQPSGFEQVDLSPLEEKAAGLESAAKLSNSDTPSKKTGNGQNIGQNALNNADQGMAFLANEYNNFTNVSGSSKESTKQTINSTVSGASLGLSIGGPWGALIGAVVGAGAGIIDSGHDNQVRIEEADKFHRDMLQERKAQRKRDYQMSKGEQVSKAEGNNVGSQSKFINRYS